MTKTTAKSLGKKTLQKSKVLAEDEEDSVYYVSDSDEREVLNGLDLSESSYSKNDWSNYGY